MQPTLEVKEFATITMWIFLCWLFSVPRNIPGHKLAVIDIAPEIHDCSKSPHWISRICKSALHHGKCNLCEVGCLQYDKSSGCLS